MKLKISVCYIFFVLSCNGQQKDTISYNNDYNLEEEIPKYAKKIIESYPGIVTGYEDNKIVFKDGSSIVYDDGVPSKSFNDLLEIPDIKDMFRFVYHQGEQPKPTFNNDPGRIRNEEFLKKVYGSTSNEVVSNLVTMVWCPKLVGQKIRVTKINGVDKVLKKISDELDEFPEYTDYVKNIGGTFNWRKINGTDRLSGHSFGMTIDINTKYSNYWQWDCKCTFEETTLIYKNQIPRQIVEIFEKHGFIWGGKWYHYDTMHFEYRPELVDN